MNQQTCAKARTSAETLVVADLETSGGPLGASETLSTDVADNLDSHGLHQITLSRCSSLAAVSW